MRHAIIIEVVNNTITMPTDKDAIKKVDNRYTDINALIKVCDYAEAYAAKRNIKEFAVVLVNIECGVFYYLEDIPYCDNNPMCYEYEQLFNNGGTVNLYVPPKQPKQQPKPQPKTTAQKIIEVIEQHPQGVITLAVIIASFIYIIL